MICKQCKNYWFYEMITLGPYHYAGPIPCLNCKRYPVFQDNYEPKETKTQNVFPGKTARKSVK